METSLEIWFKNKQTNKQKQISNRKQNKKNKNKTKQTNKNNNNKKKQYKTFLKLRRILEYNREPEYEIKIIQLISNLQLLSFDINCKSGSSNWFDFTFSHSLCS